MALSEVVYCNDVVFVVTPYINVTSSPLVFAKSTENSDKSKVFELDYIIKSTRQISEKSSLFTLLHFLLWYDKRSCYVFVCGSLTSSPKKVIWHTGWSRQQSPRESSTNTYSTAMEHMRSSRRRSRSLTKGRERVPIKYISIEVQDDQRDDVEINVLVNMIQKRQWANVSARMQVQEGINEASRVLPNKDYALHVICKCGIDHKESKYRHFRGTAPSRVNCESSSSNGSGEFSSRANSSITGSTPSSASITTNTTNTKDASESPTMESIPPKAILEAIVNAYPEACGLAGEDDATPLHW